MRLCFRPLALAAATALLGAASRTEMPKVGQPAPEFELQLVGGGTVRLSDLRGKVIVLNLWATWCGPCKHEMAALDLMQVNGGKHGLQILGLQTLDDERPFVWRKLTKVLHYPLAYKGSGPYQAGVKAVPTNYIIDRKGVLRYAAPSALSAQKFAELIVPLLNEAP